MIFTPPEWGREMLPIPESTPLYDFIIQRDCRHLYNWVEDSKTLICGASEKAYTLQTISARVEALARSLSHELGWLPNSGSAADKVVGIFSFNTIDYLVASWAIHRVGGTCLLLHPTSSGAEIQRHIALTQCRVLFTCSSLLSTSNEVLAEVGVPDSRVFLLELPDELARTTPLQDKGPKIVEHLIEQGASLPHIEPLKWKLGQGREQVAYLCPTSGTSGLQKLAQITHYNIIANVIQTSTFEARHKNGSTEIALGFLPLSHSYGLILAHLTVWRGDTYVLQASFDMQKALGAIEKYKIERLYLVPPIISALVNNPFLFELFDLSSVKSIVTGSGPFGARLAEELSKIRPSWQVLPGYGLTETAVVISLANPNYVFLGTDGCLNPGVEARLIDSDGNEIDNYGEPGELLLRSPSNMKGYLGQKEATREIFDEQGWLRTGDIAVFRIQSKDDMKTPYLDIVDRKKDIMKVKGMQVAPVEIESHLAAHPAVAEVAVVGVRDEDAGERPYAFIVRSPTVMTDEDEETLKVELNSLIEGALSEPHWLRKNITFVDEFPKSSNGKPLKYKLRQSLVAN